MRESLLLLLFVLCMVESGPGSGPLAARKAVVVSAAISLTNALQEIAQAFRTSGGGDVTFNFAASNVLARQIVNGARVDVFISADEAQMDYAQKAGAIDASTRRALLSNRLAIVTRPGSVVQSPQSLLDPQIRRVAVGDPAAVPAGVYAKVYLERAGLWTQLQSKLLPLANVRGALAAVESGGADAAIVYESDAAASRSVQLAYAFASGSGPSISYPAAIVAKSQNRVAAEKFLTFLRSKGASEIFRRFKFSVQD